MDFIKGLPMIVKKHDSIMVAMDNLSKETHFIPIKSTQICDINNFFYEGDIKICMGYPKQ